MEENIQVSVLIAARNEEANIERCLQALYEQHFPHQQIEILIGDDQSTDNTAQIILEFIADKPQFRYFLIEQEVAGLKAKANVLAQLAHHARGRYFLYCDADITVPADWVTNILKHFTPQVGIVVGVTRMQSTGYFSDLQSLEWMFIMGGVRFLALFKIPVTGMGNNMAVTAEAYRQIGGYERIGFSIVEDYALFITIVRSGYRFVQAFEEGILARSEPVPTYGELMKQRKRWTVGAMKLAWPLRLFSFITALLLPALVVMAFWYPEESLRIAINHYLHLTFAAGVIVVALRQWDLLKVVPVFWFYTMGNFTCMLVNYYLPSPTVWKGRQFSHAN
ncbi:glycosyltransferase [Telluribacter sp. SYSU D00476]|uniref:glycosyltransferase n=1 Tax=Telluribacter sp. SYSU D00476 TaxID=2811430 RepID=UPI001FF10F2C|nr:glycosyltransferase [Telluribacter sp. SYSU D00476]